MRSALDANSPVLRGLGPVLAPSQSLFQQDAAAGERTAKTTTGDYASAAMRQDSPIDGAMAWLVEQQQFQPDPGFNPFEEKSFREDAAGIDPQFHTDLLRATSRNHRLYIRDRLLQKQDDLTRLGDMGVPGNIGRFALGFVDPANLALGVASGGLTSLVRGASTGARVASGLGGAAAGGYAFERARQSVNFEDSQTDAVIAGLFGTAFSAPFVGLNAREMGRVRKAAMDELQHANDLAHAHETGEVTPEANARAEAIATQAASEEPAPLPHVVEAPSAEALAPSPRPRKNLEPAEGLQWRNADGEEFAGTVLKQIDEQHLLVEREDGKKVRVNVEDVVADTAPEGFVQGTVGAAATEHIAALTDERTAMAAARFDIHARLNKSENSVHRSTNEVMTKDAIQKSDHYAQGRSATEEKKLLQRRLGGNFHFESALAYNDAARKLGLGWIARGREENVRSFFENAGRLARGEENVIGLGRNREIEPELRRAASEFRKVMDSMLGEMKQAGVKGADGVTENPAYVNRIWNVPKMKELMKSVGEKNVVALVADSLRIPSLGLDRAVHEETARNFLTAVQRLEHSHLSTDLVLRAGDFQSLEKELAKAKLSFDEIESIKKALFAEPQEGQAADAGTAPQLKFRFQIDETASREVNGRMISVADLLENDARVLMDRYMNSMAGHVALAKKGITSRADFDAILRQASKEHEENALSRNDGEFKKEQQMLEDIYSNIVGRPMSVHSFNTGDRVAATLRAIARSAYLGQLGITAAFELYHVASLATFRSAWTQMPSFAQFVRAARNGHVPGDRLAADLRTMTGFGTEHASSYARQHELSEFTYDRKLHWAENKANALSHTVDRISGNNFFTSWSRGLAAKFITQKYADFASGKLKLDDAWRKRLVGHGIDSGDIDSVMGTLNKYTERDEHGRVEAIRYEDWSAKDPSSYHAFITAVQREVRDGIQDHDLGETWYFQHTAIGKIFTELRAFSIASHSKQFLKNLHYRDHRSLHLFTTGFVTQSMAYVMQTAVNYAHDDKKRAELLTADRIALAAYKRMSVTGLLPLFTEPLLPSHLTGMTANTENRMPWITPSMMMTGKVLSGVSQGAKSLVYGEPFSGRDAKNILTLPGSNLLGARNLVDMVSTAAQSHSQSHPAP